MIRLLAVVLALAASDPGITPGQIQEKLNARLEQAAKPSPYLDEKRGAQSYEEFLAAFKKEYPSILSVSEKEAVQIRERLENEGMAKTTLMSRREELLNAGVAIHPMMEGLWKTWLVNSIPDPWGRELWIRYADAAMKGKITPEEISKTLGLWLNEPLLSNEIRGPQSREEYLAAFKAEYPSILQVTEKEAAEIRERMSGGNDFIRREVRKREEELSKANIQIHPMMERLWKWRLAATPAEHYDWGWELWVRYVDAALAKAKAEKQKL